MNTTLFFLLRRDWVDNKTFLSVPLVFFSLFFALNYFWEHGLLANETMIKILQLAVFVFIFISATLYGVYLNYVLGTSLHVKTQLSLNRNYLFSLPLSRTKLFWMNQLRLFLPLLPFVLFGTLFTLNFKPVNIETTAFGMLLVGSCFSLLLLNYLIWISDTIEKGFVQRSPWSSIKRFFIVDPVLLTIVYFAFLRQIPEILSGTYYLILPALLTPFMMIRLNYLNWNKRL